MTAQQQNGHGVFGDIDRTEAPVRRGRVISDDEIARVYRLAKAFAMSGYYTDDKGRGVTPEQAFVKMLLGLDLGLSPAQSMMELQIVKGKPSLSAHLMATMVREHSRWDYEIVELTEDAVAILFLENGETAEHALARKPQPRLSRFTQEDAKKAGLLGGKNDMYAKYPRNMLEARAVSNGVAWFCPEVTLGLRVYHDGELDDAGSAAGRAQAQLPEPATAATPIQAPTPAAADVVEGTYVDPDTPVPPKALDPAPAAVVDMDKLNAVNAAAGTEPMPVAAAAPASQPTPAAQVPPEPAREPQAPADAPQDPPLPPDPTATRPSAEDAAQWAEEWCSIVRARGVSLAKVKGILQAVGVNGAQKIKDAGEAEAEIKHLTIAQFGQIHHLLDRIAPPPPPGVTPEGAIPPEAQGTLA